MQIKLDDLVAGYCKGDPAKTDLLLAMLHVIVPKILRKADKGLTDDEVEELSSRTMDRLHGQGKLKLYRGPGKFLGWVRTVVFNVRRDYLRGVRHERDNIAGPLIDGETGRERPVDPAGRSPSGHPDPVRAVLCREIMDSFLNCLGRQSDHDRELLRRRLVDHQEYGQIAAATGISEAQAHLRFFRARKKMAECLSAFGYGPDEMFSGSRKDSGKGGVLS
ncbi:MAG: sigma-70 family RNA polymerase sigma factor [Kiritimatiellae bacterium]|nr:sigma-70 family RNA polymerase sigma factor [Kiritimatiellia bacterium]